MTEPGRAQQRLDTIFHVLSHHRRRHTLRVLFAYEPPITLADLADEVAVRENGTRLDEISAEDVQEIYLSLYHSHIPKLAEAGLVQYEQEQDLVTLGEASEQVEHHQELLIAE